ncbi:terminase small subunit [Cycloclasticus pugetii]|uniref:terminase small subunit n=1 Tax=Cycloclasticus pugetii TaxID=34068 RepID=UPI002409F949|nr:terminase small subunit [Cycloclasticus pugetii]MDF1829972.1 terminase small subunit [Cycloclasticus pugetii]
MSLTPKQIRFVDEYLVDFNASRAAVAAGFSSKSAKVQGSRLLTNVNVRRLVERHQEATSKRLRITRDDVIKGLVVAAEQARLNKDPTSMIAAMSEVSKMMGFYASKPREKTAETDYDSLKRKFELMSDMELRALVKCS